MYLMPTYSTERWKKEIFPFWSVAQCPVLSSLGRACAPAERRATKTENQENIKGLKYFHWDSFTGNNSHFDIFIQAPISFLTLLKLKTNFINEGY